MKELRDSRVTREEKLELVDLFAQVAEATFGGAIKARDAWAHEARTAKSHFKFAMEPLVDKTHAAIVVEKLTLLAKIWKWVIFSLLTASSALNSFPQISVAAESIKFHVETLQASVCLTALFALLVLILL